MGNMLTHYILDENGSIKEEPDVLKWAEWFEKNRSKRFVKKTEVEAYHVSTIFLGLDHSFSKEAPPVLFETMVFENKETEIEMPIVNSKRKIHKSLDLDGMFQRYETREQALVGHEEIVKLVEVYQSQKQKEEVEKKHDETETVREKSEGAN